MNQHKAKNILVDCFEGLPKKNRDRLAFHYEKGTTILCGKLGHLFANKDGA